MTSNANEADQHTYQLLVAQLKAELAADGVVLIVKGGRLGNAMIMQYASTEDAAELHIAIEALSEQLRQLTAATGKGEYSERLATLAPGKPKN